MKVLMTADAVGGVWQYSVDLAEGLVRNGVEVVLATMGPRPTPEQRRDAAGIPQLELVESDYALEWMRDPWADVDASLDWLQSLASRVRPDLIHCNGYSYAAASWDCPVLVVAHSCVYSWWRAVHRTSPPAEWSAYKQRVVSGLSVCDLVVAPTESMLRCLECEYGTPRQKTRVIRNFSRAMRTEVEPKQDLCLAAGRLWDEAKNLKILEAAAQDAPWPIEVAGPKQDPQTGAAMKTALRLLGNLPHQDLMRKMQSAALFLHPALYEPFGLAVLEAARARCCLLLSDIPSMRELWDGAAVFVDPLDAPAWAEQIRRLSSDQALRNTFAYRAQERSCSYSAFQATTEYLQVYANLVGTSNNSHGVAA